jgi:type VI secretion system protein ImpE
MLAENLLSAGQLAQALAELQRQVRTEPANAKYRVFLFQLLSVTGDWARALTQLNVAGDLDAGTLAMVQTYREALQCEVLRGDVFAGKRLPLVFGEPQEWLALLLESFRLAATGEFGKAEDLRGRAFDAAPARSGTLTASAGEPRKFEWIADADPRLGPVLEAVINGKYYWVPFETVGKLHFDEPEDLRDFVWMPAQFTWMNGGQTVALIPTRYAGSESSTDDAIRLSRKTEWIEAGPGLSIGQGQRMLATDIDEFALMDVRTIVFDGFDPASVKDGGAATPEEPTRA